MAIKGNYIDSDFTDRQLRKFLNKFSIADLYAIRKLFYCLYDHDLNRFYDIFEETLEGKYRELANNYEVPIIPEKISISSLAKNNFILSKKELKLLKDVTDEADMNVCINIDSFDDYYDDTLASDLEDYYDLLEDELLKRYIKQHPKAKVTSISGEVPIVEFPEEVKEEPKTLKLNKKKKEDE